MQIGPSAHICAAKPNDRAITRWPGFPEAARGPSGRVATGCGLDAEACRRSGLGEAVELMKSCVWGDEPRVTGSMRALGDRAIAPRDLIGFSDEQIRDRDRVNAVLAGHDWVPPPLSDDREIDWMTVQDAVSGAEVFVPADAVLIGLREAGDAAAVAVADSNGCACGPTAEAARLAAVLELIERDAAARWWFGGHKARDLPLSVLAVQPGLADHIQGRTRVTRVFDITSDFGVPVVAAASFAPDGSAVALGFAAKPDRVSAAVSAVTEMLAIETTLPPWRDLGDDPLMMRWLREASAALSQLSQGVDVADPTVGTVWTLDACLEAAERSGCRILFADLSRGDDRSPVFRALSPHLCPLRPRLGRPRLGLRSVERTQTDIETLAPLIPG